MRKTANQILHSGSLPNGRLATHVNRPVSRPSTAHKCCNSATVAANARHAALARPTIAINAAVLLAISVLAPAHAQTSLYTLNGGTASESNQTFAATLTDQSAVYVLNSGHLTLTNRIMTKTGDTSNLNNSSQYGLSAGVLAKSAGVVLIYGGSMTTNVLGANGLFATGSGSSISMSGVRPAGPPFTQRSTGASCLIR